MRKLTGWIAFAAGAGLMIAPQAAMGLKELRWMQRCAFSGEALAAIVVLALAYYLLEFKPPRM